jgi:hypothetical protein
MEKSVIHTVDIVATVTNIESVGVGCTVKKKKIVKIRAAMSPIARCLPMI